MASRHGDSDARSALAGEARPLRRLLLRYFSRRLRDSAEVEDLVQDVFVRVAARDSQTPIEHLGKYVHQTAASVLADHARRRSARRSDAHVEFNPDLHGETDFDPERILSGTQEVDQVIAAMLSLPERTRTIFVLRRFDDRPPAEIARQLGISVSAVEKHMVRAARHIGTLIGVER